MSGCQTVPLCQLAETTHNSGLYGATHARAWASAAHDREGGDGGERIDRRVGQSRRDQAATPDPEDAKQHSCARGNDYRQGHGRDLGGGRLREVVGPKQVQCGPEPNSTPRKAISSSTTVPRGMRIKVRYASSP